MRTREEEVGPGQSRGLSAREESCRQPVWAPFRKSCWEHLSWCLAAPLRPPGARHPLLWILRWGDRTAEMGRCQETPGSPGAAHPRTQAPESALHHLRAQSHSIRRPESGMGGHLLPGTLGWDCSQLSAVGQGPQGGRVGRGSAETPCLPGVSTATAPSASPPTSSGTCGTSTTRRSPSSATCATAASGSRPTWTGT